MCARRGRVHMCVCYLISCVCACVRGDVCGIISCVCSRRTRSYVRVLSVFMCVCVYVDRKKPPPPGGVSYLLCSLVKNCE